MKAEDSKLYTSVNEYLNGPDGMDNEVTMWAVAGGILIKESVRKSLNTAFGGLHANSGIEARLNLPTLNVLDMCSGPGNFSNYLSLFNPNLEVTGIDTNKVFIKYANKKYKHQGWKFILADACTMSLGKRFDFVLASSAYHHIEDWNKPDFVFNMESHLKEGGKIIMCENFLPSYHDPQSRKNSIKRYYNLLEEHYSKNRATENAKRAIKEVCALELSDEEEHKVDFQRFKEHLILAKLEIELDIPVWQPDEFKKDNAGSHVILLNN